MYKFRFEQASNTNWPIGEHSSVNRKKPHLVFTNPLFAKLDYDEINKNILGRDYSIASKAESVNDGYLDCLGRNPLDNKWVDLLNQVKVTQPSETIPDRVTLDYEVTTDRVLTCDRELTRNRDQAIDGELTSNKTTPCTCYQLDQAIDGELTSNKNILNTEPKSTQEASLPDPLELVKAIVQNKKAKDFLFKYIKTYLHNFFIGNTLMKIEEVAEYLNVSVTTVKKLLSNSKLKGNKVGRQIRFYKKDVDQLLQTGKLEDD